jgi:membrane-associated protein
MTYGKFLTYCIAGAVLWVTSITSLGYVLGNHPWVKDHFETVVFGIIGISVLPMIYQALKSKFKK